MSGWKKAALISGLLLMFFAAGGLLLTSAGVTGNRRVSAKETYVNKKTAAVTAAAREPEPEPAPEEKKPSVTEENGVSYLELEGVRILLVNKVYALPEDYGGEDEEAADALRDMTEAAASDGIELFVVSGYRSYETQRTIYDRYVSQFGQEETDRFSARPGHSEHQAGLAYDLNSLENSFKDTEAFAWLSERCAEFGFILRYAEESEWATGYMFEPWHYRYIGSAELAGKVMESGVSLEEYAGLITGENQSGYRD